MTSLSARAQPQALQACVRPCAHFLTRELPPRARGGLVRAFLSRLVDRASKPRNGGRRYYRHSTKHRGAKGLGVLHHFPFFHFHKNLSSSTISVAFSLENCFPQKLQKRPKIRKHTKHEPLECELKSDDLSSTFYEYLAKSAGNQKPRKNQNPQP